MKLLFMIASASFLFLGFILDISLLLLVGAIVYFADGLLSLVYTYKTAKVIRTEEFQGGQDPSSIDRVAQILDGAITICGLIMVAVSQSGNDSAFTAAGLTPLNDPN
ncbi:MAG: hypothetical protein COC22_03290 [Flavobacteriaceae bacterium]|nr:MAG: hypothetical protein COC22_03290 [Flavobacteriaceae bacterium]